MSQEKPPPPAPTTLSRGERGSASQLGAQARSSLHTLPPGQSSIAQPSSMHAPPQQACPVRQPVPLQRSSTQPPTPFITAHTWPVRQLMPLHGSSTHIPETQICPFKHAC